MKRQDREYWMTFDAEDLASHLLEYHTLKLESSYNPIYHAVIRNQYAYYSTIFDAQSWLTSINYMGEQGELLKMSVPHARTLLRQLLTLLTKQKLAFKAVAQVSKTSVQEQVRIANALTAEVVKNQCLDTKGNKLMENCLVDGTSFIKTTWRSDLGRPRAVDTNDKGEEYVVYEGDVEISTPNFFDLTYDYSVENWEDLDWVEVRVKRSRWSLIAQHPDLEQEILSLPAVQEDERTRHYNSADNRDLVYVYEMYHKPTAALPKGRMLIYADVNCIFFDDDNRYECIPIEQLKPEPIPGIGFGYPMLASLLPAQEMLDHSYSCLATNQSSLGVTNILNPTGSNISVQELYGMNFIDYDPAIGKPEALDLLKSAPELFKFPETMLGAMQQMSFINAAVRGELPSSTSGVAIATLTTNALEFLSSYSQQYQQVMEKTVMHAINAYKKFAKVERLIRITGKNYQSFTKEFSGETLDPIESVEMQTINPLMQNIAGRIDIAEKSIEKGFIKDIKSYVAILDGAPIDRIIDVELTESDLILTENEKMMEGEQCPVLSTDNHAMHIMKHKSLLNDPEIRINSHIIQIVQDHILEHLQLQKTTDPLLMAMANTGMIPQGMPPAPQQGGGAPGPGGPPPGGPPPGPGGMSDSDTQPAVQLPEIDLPEAEPADRARDLLGRG